MVGTILLNVFDFEQQHDVDQASGKVLGLELCGGPHFDRAACCGQTSRRQHLGLYMGLAQSGPSDEAACAPQH